jgi:hypothetical protein
MRFRGPLPSSIDPDDNGISLVALKQGRYTVRRWINRAEQDAEAVAKERTEAYQHPYHAESPTIGEQIDAINGPIFGRNELTGRRAANDRIGG